MWPLLMFAWERSDVVVSALDFSCKGQWFDAQSLPSCCFLRQKTPHTDILLWVTLGWTSILSKGGVTILSVASCYRTRDKLRHVGPLDSCAT